MSEMVTLLQTLSNCPGISGNESAVRQSLRAFLVDHVDELHVDALGNLIALKKGTGASALRVLVSAHMDEVGFMVVDHTAEGNLRVESVGGVNPQVLPGLLVSVGQDAIPGVIGIRAIHRIESDDSSQVPSLKNLVVDIGSASREEAARVAPPGTPVVFATQSRDLGCSVSGKALDDRAGCTVLATLLKGETFPFDLFGVFTVQEEVGLRGAGVAAYAVDPDVAIILEGTNADDLPKPEQDVSPTTELGKGPAITVMDRSFIAPPRLVRHFIQTAEAAAIPYQLKQPGIGGTDAGSIHRAREGVPSITVAVPCRYIHGPVSLLRTQDLEAALKLVRLALETLTAEILSLV